MQISSRPRPPLLHEFTLSTTNTPLPFVPCPSSQPGTACCRQWRPAVRMRAEPRKEMTRSTSDGYRTTDLRRLSVRCRIGCWEPGLDLGVGTESFAFSSVRCTATSTLPNPRDGVSVAWKRDAQGHDSYQGKTCRLLHFSGSLSYQLVRKQDDAVRLLPRRPGSLVGQGYLRMSPSPLQGPGWPCGRLDGRWRNLYYKPRRPIRIPSLDIVGYSLPSYRFRQLLSL